MNLKRPGREGQVIPLIDSSAGFSENPKWEFGLKPIRRKIVIPEVKPLSIKKSLEFSAEI